MVLRKKSDAKSCVWRTIGFGNMDAWRDTPKQFDVDFASGWLAVIGRLKMDWEGYHILYDKASELAIDMMRSSSLWMLDA